MRAAIIGLALACAATLPAAAQENDERAISARLDRFLAKRPVIDGHNDLPWALRDDHGGLDTVDLTKRTDRLDPPLQTDIPRLTAGGYGGQFWSLWIPASTTGPAAVKTTLEQIDLVRRMVARYPQAFALADTADAVVAARASGRVGSLMGIEGGHQIDGSLAVLRQYRVLGVRYMTLTHSSNIAWADSGTDTPRLRGLAPFGREVIAEMNRIGMIVDVSHVSPDTARAAIAASRAPVIFSHSNAYAVNPHPRNVPDDVLKAMAAKGGVIMVNVYPPFVSAKVRAWQAERTAEEARLGESADAASRLAAWERAHPEPTISAADIVEHIEHIARVAGRDHVGLGGDYDGISGAGPEGMKGADGWRQLFAELMRRGWSDADLEKLAGGNVLRVLREVDRVAGAAPVRS